MEQEIESGTIMDSIEGGESDGVLLETEELSKIEEGDGKGGVISTEKCDSENDTGSEGDKKVKCDSESVSDPDAVDAVNAVVCENAKVSSGDAGKVESVESWRGNVFSEPDDKSKSVDRAETKEVENEAEDPKESAALEAEVVEPSDKPNDVILPLSKDPPQKETKEGEAGIDNEMEAMFGESLDKSDVGLETQPAQPENKSNVPDDQKKTKCDISKPVETPDESNLEVMMEKLHADKIGSPLSKPKESTGMELSDVLQALTEDHPFESKSNERTTKSASKPCSKLKKKSAEGSESKSGDEAPERRTTRSRVATQSSGKKEVISDDSSKPEAEQEENIKSLRKKHSDFSGQGSSSNSKGKIIKEEEEKEKEESNSEDEKSESGKSDRKKGEVGRQGRGRPKKHPIPPGEEPASKEKAKVEQDEEGKEKFKHRKVGKKKVEEESSDSECSKSNEKSSQQKRGRGRPRKRLLDEDESEEKSKSTVVGKGKKTLGESPSEESSDDEPVAKTSRPGIPLRRSNDGSGNEESTVPKGLRPIKMGIPSDSRKAAEKVVSKSNKVCVVLDCRQHCLPSLGISLHRFPMANNPMRAHWLALINETPPGPNTAYMCSKHFKENDYTYDESKHPSETFYRKLKPLAFPTLGLPVDQDVIDEVRSRVADLGPGKDSKEVTRTFLKEVKKKIKVEDEPKSKTKGSSEAAEGNSRRSEGSRPTIKAGSRSPSPKLVDTSTPSRTPAPRKKMDYESKGRTPGTNCSVPCCGNNLFETRAEGLNISYYRFPFDEALAARWIKKIGDPDLVARTARICSDHFLDKDFEGGTLGGKRNLKPKAVPSQYLSERKPRKRDQDYDQESADEESEDDTSPAPRTYIKKKSKSEPAKKPKKPKPDTSAIPMPLPIIEEVDIKSEPASDNEVVGQEYAPSDPGSAVDEPEEHVTVKKDGAKAKDGEEEGLEDEEPTKAKRGRGRPRKDAWNAPPRKIVVFGGLSLPVVGVERLGQRVIDAAETGSLRVRIKESAESKARAQQPKPTQKLKRKLPESDSDSPPKVKTKPGPLCKKKQLVLKSPVVPKNAKSQKGLKMSDPESSESDVDDPPTQLERDVASTSFAKSPNPVKVKLAELPTFLQYKAGEDSSISDDNTMDTMDITSEELDAIINSNKSEKDKIIKLVEQRISEHTKIIEGKSMGAQELADHNKILQGSALVLKKLAEKSGKPLTPSQVISLNVPDNTAVTPGRTIVLKKVPDPGKLGLKPPRTISSPTSPVKPPTAIVTPQSTPARAFKSTIEDVLSDESKQPASALEKIRDYDNLMKKYLSAVLDKNVMSKKYTESKDAQKLLENKLAEKIKECENLKRKAASLNAKMNRINTALEYFLTPNQIKLALQETKKVAWSPEEMLTAFTIKHLSKACYLFLRHKLNYPLPGISSLQRWMTMLSKDKTGDDDDDDNIADEDLSDKEESQEILVEGPGVVNEISGTLEEINAGGMPGEEEEFIAKENVHQVKDSNQSSPFQVVFENEGDSNSNRKVIILKKVPNSSGKLKMKSKLQISASKNDVNVNSTEESDNKNELYKLLGPGTKTISMATSSSSPEKRKVLVTKKIQEKEKITFQRLPQVRKEVQKAPTIQMVKSEPHEELRQFTGEEVIADECMQMEVTEHDNETIVKPEDVSHQLPDDQQQLDQQDGTEQKYFTISDLNSTQMEEHVVENVEHSLEEGKMQHSAQQGEEGGHQQTVMVSDEEGGESGQVLHHSAAGLEELVQLATSGEQQISFTATEDLTRSSQYVAYPQGPQGEITYTQGPQGEITLSEDMNNMTAVVINDIDDDQLSTLLNVVEGKSEQPSQFGQKKIVYQTIDNQKNVIVLQPDSQAFMEEDEGTNSGAPRVYIINDEGHIVSSGGREPPGPCRLLRSREISFVGSSGPPQSHVGLLGPSGPSQPHEIGFIDSASFAELGLKLAEPETFSIGNLIQDYAINSPKIPPRKQTFPAVGLE